MKVLENYKNKQKITKEDLKKITFEERETLELLANQEDKMNVDLMFFEEEQAGKVFKIPLLIESILPSRLKTIFDTMNFVDNIDVFSPEDGKPIEFSFQVLRHFLPRSKEDPSYDKHFLEITEKIFKDNPVEYRFILKFVMEKIRARFRREESILYDVLQGYMLLLFLDKLGILNGIKRKEDSLKLPQEIKSQISEKIEEFFNEHKNFFDSPEKKAIFLTGVLVQNLLSIQWRVKDGATPFRSRLKGLNMDIKDIHRVFKEAQNKLEEYGKNSYKDLEAVISYYFVSFNNHSELSRDEINFCFTLGMNLSRLFKKEGEKSDEQSA
jgi:CRISPR-associated protein Csh1